MNNVTLGPETAMTRTQSRTTTAADYGLLIVRLALGVIFFAHGAQKVFGWFGGPGLANTVGFFHGMGIPAPLAYLASFTELLGGIAVLLGLLSRLAALGLAVNMLVAIFHVHLSNGFFAEHKGFEFPLALLAMSLLLVLTGPGRLAIADMEPSWLRRK
jgi:putative oxidoreductase